MPDIYEKTSQLLEEHFQSNWEPDTTGYPVDWENVPFEQPEDGKWVRFSIKFGESNQASLGRNPMERIVGLVFLQFFHPRNVGTRTLRGAIGEAADLFRYRSLFATGCQIDIRSARVVEVGEKADHYQSNLQIVFHVQHYATNG